MSEAPRVTIVTPTFNHERFIGQCVESVFAQTYPHWEMVIVDDGSSDATADVVERYSDPRIRLIRQANQGIHALAATYNRALAESSGELVAILEGDDFWPSYKLEQQVPAFADPSVVVVSGLTSIVGPDGSYRMVTPNQPLDETAIHNRPVGSAAGFMMDPERLIYTFPVATMVRRSALDRIGGFQQPSHSRVVDYPTILRLTIEGEFRFLPHVLGMWRRHEGSTTSKHLPEILDSAYRTTFEFVRSHRHRLPLSDAELDAIELRWEYFLGNLSVLRMRMLAGTGKIRPALQAAREGRIYRRTRMTDLSLRLSILSLRLGRSPEWLFRVAGRPDWRRLVAFDSGDQVVTEEDLNRPRPLCRWRG